MAYTPFPINGCNFASDADGWTGVSTTTNASNLVNTPTTIIDYSASEQALEYKTPSSIPANTHYFFNASPSFRGDMSKMYDGKINIKVELTAKPTTKMTLNRDDFGITIHGPNGTIGYELFKGEIDPPYPSTIYTISIDINDTAGWKTFKGNTTWANSTQKEITDVLSNVTNFLIQTDCAQNLEYIYLRSCAFTPRELPGNPMPVEVHTINVSQGDSILVINRDLYKLESVIDTWIDNKINPPAKPADSAEWVPYAITNEINIEGTIIGAVLIDAGNRQFGINAINYMKKYGVQQNEYACVITHFHDDHYDGFIYSIPKGKTKPGNENVIFYSFYPHTIYDCGNDVIFDPLTYTGKGPSNQVKYKNNISYLCTQKGVNYWPLIPNNIRRGTTGSAESAIDIGTTYDPVKLTCLAANGYFWDGTKKTSARPATAKKEEQNGRSVALVLEYGDFRYYLAGDLGGADSRARSQSLGLDYNNKQSQGSKGYWDVELPLAGALPNIYKADTNRANTLAGHICSIKCSHHGSQWHSNTKLLKTMQPAVCTISAGLKKTFHKHPTQDVLNRIDYDPAKVGSTSKNQYSPKWPDTSTLPQIDNSLKNQSQPPTYHYYITEMKKLAGQFQRAYPNGKIIGSIIVRPYLSDIAKIALNPQATNEINIQIYGQGEMSDLYNKQKYNSNLTQPVAQNASYPATTAYPVGPWVHTCTKH